MAFAKGGIAWDHKDVPVCIRNGDQQYIRMAADGSGGAIIVWENYRGGSESDIYAQWITSDGCRLWDAGG